MLRTRVMPCLLLKDGALVKTIRFKKPSYIGDPINAIRIYNEKEVDELVFLDISATKNRRGPDFQVISDIASECFMPVTYGGGVHDLAEVRELFRLGIEKVAINTCAIENPDFVSQIADRFGSQSVVASIDVRRKSGGRYEALIRGGEQLTGLDPVELALRLQKAGIGEILLTSIDRDGTYEGYDIELVKRVTDAVSVPVIACGGAGTIQDFRAAVEQGGASACAAGSMFVYFGRNRAVLVNFPLRSELESVLC